MTDNQKNQEYSYYANPNSRDNQKNQAPHGEGRPYSGYENQPNAPQQPWQNSPPESGDPQPYYPYPRPSDQPRQRRGSRWEKQGAGPQKKQPAPPPKTKTKSKATKGLVGLCVLLAVICAGLMVANGVMTGYIQTQEGLKKAAYEQFLNRHPLQYRAMIEQEAAKYNLHPAFLEAIILNESSYRRDAESSVGARGLMQIMEDTAGWIAGKLNEGSSYHFDLMYEPEANIRYGAWYLGFLADRFGGDPVLVAAAYHAGQGEVAKWLSNSQYSQDGQRILIENMIDGPTKNYVKKVTQAYAAYKGIYYTAQGEPAGL